MTDSWTRLTATTLTARVYEALRDRIIAGKVAAGEFIREQEVSSGLGVSRTPVREALGRLASEGFLERIAHRGFRVPKESIAELVELYPIIGALELLAARLSFPLIDQDALRLLRETNRNYADAKQRDDVEAGIELNNQFHLLLSEHCGNGRLCELLDELRAQVKRLENLGPSPISMSGTLRSRSTMKFSRPSRARITSGAWPSLKRTGSRLTTTSLRGSWRSVRPRLQPS